MSDLMKQKLDIAKRAGELHGELAELARLLKNIKHKKNCIETLRVVTGNHEFLESYRFEKNGTTLHDLVLGWINVQIEKRETELNDLIKILT